MPANTSPVFPLLPIIGFANISTAQTSRTPSNVTGCTLIGAAAGANGQRVDAISIVATGTTTAGNVRIFYYPGSGNAQLLYEIPVSAVTPSATVLPWMYSFTIDNLVLPPTTGALYASPEKSEAFIVYKFGGDY